MTNSPTSPAKGPATTLPSGTPIVRGPERFTTAVATAQRPSWPKAIGAGLLLVLLVAGIPGLLVWLSGPPPVPTRLPSREDLTQPLSVDALFVVFTAVVWLAWLQFVLCVAVELVSLVRGGGLPPPVPLSGPSQTFARALVATLLVGASVLAASGSASAAPASPEVGSSVSAVQVAGDLADAAASGAGAAAAGLVTDGPGATGDREESRAQARGAQTPVVHVPGVPADMTDVVGKKIAIVEPPQGHYHDNLWDIAERHLDDGRRWKEIFELNEHRQQPDGQVLVLGRLIQPGWVLIMPDDATGVVRVQAAPEARDGGVQEQGARGDRDGASSGAAVGSATPGGIDSADGGSREAASVSVPAFLGGGLFAAVLAGALLAERRRRRSREPDEHEREAEVMLRFGADEDRVTRLDKALRGLNATCRAERLTLPQVYAATVSEETIELRIAPAAPKAPAPWAVAEGGLRWRLDHLAEQPTSTGHAPYPGLVCLGRDDDGVDLLVDLESVGSIVSITGSHSVACEVASALAVQLATVPWADTQVVRSYRLSAALGKVAGSSLQEVDDLGELLDSWATSPPRRNSSEVLSGRLGRSPGIAPQYLVMGDAPIDEESQSRLSALSGAGSRGIGIVSAVALSGARWRLRVDDAGRLTIPLLDTEVQAVRLPAADVERMSGLFSKAREQAPDQNDAGRVSVPEPPRPGEDAEWRLAAVAVGVLGGIEVRASGGLDAARVELATEIAVFLALQPTPVHPSVVGASIWPRGVTLEVRDATIARVRDWLGTGADGTHLLRETDEGRLYLCDDVAVDWHAFCALVRRSRGASEADERDLLRRALRLVRGELMAARPGSRYSWLPRTRLEHQGIDVVVDAAHRLAELSVDGDPGGAAQACRAGLRLAPTSQVLWRDLLNAESQHPDGPGTAVAAEEMLDALQAARTTPEAETDALMIELLPEQWARGDSA